MPLPPKRLLMRMPTQQSKVMKRKAREAVERERGEDNDGDNDWDVLRISTLHTITH